MFTNRSISCLADWEHKSISGQLFDSTKERQIDTRNSNHFCKFLMSSITLRYCTHACYTPFALWMRHNILWIRQQPHSELVHEFSDWLNPGGNLVHNSVCWQKPVQMICSVHSLLKSHYHSFSLISFNFLAALKVLFWSSFIITSPNEHFYDGKSRLRAQHGLHADKCHQYRP